MVWHAGVLRTTLLGRGQSGFSALNDPDDTCPGLWVLVYSY
jgi:hypothetical protein